MIKIDNFEQWNDDEMGKNSPENYYTHSNFIIRFIEKKRIAYVLRLLSAQAGDEILEIGCGQGHILDLIKQGKLFGLDLSDRMLADARARLGDRARIFKANAEDFIGVLGGQKFNKIITSEVLEHTQHPEAVINQAHESLVPGGMLVVSVPNERLINQLKTVLISLKIFQRFFGGISSDATQEFHLHSFDLKLLKTKVGNKFKIDRVLGAPFFFLPIRYVVRFTKIG